MKQSDEPIIISIIIITIARDSLYPCLEKIYSQKVAERFEVILVLQGEVDEARIKEIDKGKNIIHVLRRPFGLGFATYRNEGIKQASGNIITFIDDDEWPQNDFWLENITNPILRGQCRVTTAGTEIPVTGNYLTDCISYLGYPGGGNVGFSKMWSVDKEGWTTHICTGNFAFSREINLLFKADLKSGSEDVDFGKQLADRSISVLYVPEATLLHQPRTGLINLIKWYFKRGKSLYEYSRHSVVDSTQIQDKKRSVKNIFLNVLKTRYIIGVAFLFFLQNMVFISGYYYAKLTDAS